MELGLQRSQHLPDDREYQYRQHGVSVLRPIRFIDDIAHKSRKVRQLRLIVSKPLKASDAQLDSTGRLTKITLVPLSSFGLGQGSLAGPGYPAIRERLEALGHPAALRDPVRRCRLSVLPGPDLYHNRRVPSPSTKNKHKLLHFPTPSTRCQCPIKEARHQRSNRKGSPDESHFRRPQMHEMAGSRVLLGATISRSMLLFEEDFADSALTLRSR